MGGVGFVKDYPVEKFYRDCKIGKSSCLIGTSIINHVQVLCLVVYFAFFSLELLSNEHGQKLVKSGMRPEKFRFQF